MRRYISESLVSINSLSNPRYRLFCFPHAGGSSSFYYAWASLCTEKNIELVSIQLPGREQRIREKAMDKMEDITDVLYREIVNYSELPFVFWGHSLGGMMSFDLCKKLFLSKQKLPNHLFVSSCRAPHLPVQTDKTIHNLSEERFIDKLKLLNGTPIALINNSSFKELYFPILRADFKVAESYHEQNIIKLPINITSIVGDIDVVGVYETTQWNEYTQKRFSHNIFKGDHFYLNQHYETLINLIDDLINLED